MCTSQMHCGHQRPPAAQTADHALSPGNESGGKETDRDKKAETQEERQVSRAERVS